jgi:hypothetical protein
MTDVEGTAYDYDDNGNQIVAATVTISLFHGDYFLGQGGALVTAPVSMQVFLSPKATSWDTTLLLPHGTADYTYRVRIDCPTCQHQVSEAVGSFSVISGKIR